MADEREKGTRIGMGQQSQRKGTRLKTRGSEKEESEAAAEQQKTGFAGCGLGRREREETHTGGVEIGWLLALLLPSGGQWSVVTVTVAVWSSVWPSVWPSAVAFRCGGALPVCAPSFCLIRR